jgi:hypothetical protein
MSLTLRKFHPVFERFSSLSQCRLSSYKTRVMRLINGWRGTELEGILAVERVINQANNVRTHSQIVV